MVSVDVKQRLKKDHKLDNKLELRSCLKVEVGRKAAMILINKQNVQIQYLFIFK